VNIPLNFYSAEHYTVIFWWNETLSLRNFVHWWWFNLNQALTHHLFTHFSLFWPSCTLVEKVTSVRLTIMYISRESHVSEVKKINVPLTYTKYVTM